LYIQIFYGSITGSIIPLSRPTDKRHNMPRLLLARQGMIVLFIIYRLTYRQPQGLLWVHFAVNTDGAGESIACNSQWNDWPSTFCDTHHEQNKSTVTTITSDLLTTENNDNQKTGASLKNNRPSSFLTHRATALAAPTAALLGNRGESAMYNSNGCVIYSTWSSSYTSSQSPYGWTATYPAHYTFSLGPYILQFQRPFLTWLGVDCIMQNLIQRNYPGIKNIN